MTNNNLYVSLEEIRKYLITWNCDEVIHGIGHLPTIDLGKIDELKIGVNEGYTKGGYRDYEKGYDDALIELKQRLTK